MNKINIIKCCITIILFHYTRADNFKYNCPFSKEVCDICITKGILSKECTDNVYKLCCENQDSVDYTICGSMCTKDNRMRHLQTYDASGGDDGGDDGVDDGVDDNEDNDDVHIVDNSTHNSVVKLGVTSLVVALLTYFI